MHPKKVQESYVYKYEYRITSYFKKEGWVVVF